MSAAILQVLIACQRQTIAPSLVFLFIEAGLFFRHSLFIHRYLQRFDCLTSGSTETFLSGTFLKWAIILKSTFTRFLGPVVPSIGRQKFIGLTVVDSLLDMRQRKKREFIFANSVTVVCVSYLYWHFAHPWVVFKNPSDFFVFYRLATLNESLTPHLLLICVAVG